MELHMTKLMTSLQVLQDSAREAILRQQVKNMRDYNRRWAVSGAGEGQGFMSGDLFWVKDANVRKNKMKQRFQSPYFICQMVGEQAQAAELSPDGKQKIVRSVEHLCHYHAHARVSHSKRAEASTSAQGGDVHQREMPEEPFT